jgi:SAM-dependent methyltransferase
VLDLGTGTGIWAIDFADQFPLASVVAADLSPIQPVEVPPNLEFQIDDFYEPWTFTKESFDFIHARSIYGCVSDYSALYSEVLKHLKPGGWYEQAEISVVPRSEDDSLRGTALEMWGPLALEGGDKFGKSFRIAEDTKELMEAAGFLHVTYRTFKWPKDPKLKEIGAYNRLRWADGMEGWAVFLFTKAAIRHC